ncbi:hypothetical protein [Nannocystis bainbridge]|uniref:Integrase catalytic domain-containing protein n=1 Tax=Nannocystis bainbridge TaxID=2995303 RepID=A0ABT5DQ87_9BACT|nr:hypothetical protein [Nannocystis bainbridge]MDC0715829.1 hypothetical protein [Nannocystis bainbridge]
MYESPRTAISEWIEVFYNRPRRDSSIGDSTPIAYEENFYAEQAQTQAA